MKAKPTAPTHLSATTRKWFEQVVRDYELESHHLKILELAGSAWDEYQTARAAIAKHGQPITGR